MTATPDPTTPDPTTADAPDERRLFVLADRALDAVVGRIGDDVWDRTLPADFARRGTDRVPTLREVLTYHAYDDAWVPDMLAGRTMDEVGPDSWSGDLLGDDPAAAFAALVDRACAAAGALDDLDRTVHCSFGDFPAREYLWQVVAFRGLRAYDIARAVGLEPQLPDELVAGMWAGFAPRADEWRTYGVFPPAVAVPDDAPLLDRLLGLTGRVPPGR